MARGREAESPTQIPAKGWGDILKRVWSQIGEDHVALIAAGVAFYGLLAIFPGLAALMAVAGILFDPQTVVDQLGQLGAVLPEEAATIIIGQATDVAGSAETGLRLTAIVSVLLALWSASAGVSSLMEGINIAYDEEDQRGFLKRTLVRLGLTLMLILGFVLIVGIAVALPVALGFLADLAPPVEVAIGVLRWVVIFGIVVALLAALYRWAPNREDAQWKWTTPGALVATALWLVGSIAFSLYVRNFASYQETFGALAGVVILLMWLWLSAYIILFGAELDSEMEAQTRHDTTTGDEAPMGERGAVKADTLGEARG
jgi:membrane protein